MKKAVLFDLFGTLVPSPPMAEYRQMVDDVAETLGVPIDDFFEPWMAVNDGRLNGSFGSSEAEVEHVAAQFGIVPSDEQMRRCVAVRRDAVRRWVTPEPETVAALESLVSNQTKLALVSDCVFDVPAIWAGSGLAPFFDTTVFSCEQRIRKPDRRMYETALGSLDIGPDDALFVGDGGSGELQGADSLGIDAVLLDSHSAAPDVLRVDVRDWDGPSVASITEVVELVSRGPDETAARRGVT